MTNPFFSSHNSNILLCSLFIMVNEFSRRKNEKYKIIFDTNLIRQNSEDNKNVLFNNTLQDIFNFIHSNNIRRDIVI